MRKLVIGIVGVMVLAFAAQSQAVGTGTLSKASGWYPAGTNLTVTAVSGVNSEFGGWLGDTNGATITDTQIVFTVDAPHSITGVFSHILWDIEALAVVNGAISPTGITQVPQSSNQTYTITPDVNYHIVDVEVDGSSIGVTNSYTFSGVSTSHTIWASFAIDEYQVVFDLGANGTLQSGSLTQMVAYSSAATAPAVNPNTGYNFEGWDSQAYTNVTGPLTINAQYSLQQFTLTINSIRGAGVPAVNTVTTNNYNTSVSASITNSPIEIFQDTQYECTGWLGSGSIGNGSTTNTGSFSLTNNTVITWQWSTNYWVELNVLGE